MNLLAHSVYVNRHVENWTNINEAPTSHRAHRYK